MNDTLAKNGIKDGYIRLVVTRGAGALGLDPNKCSDPQVIIITDHTDHDLSFRAKRAGQVTQQIRGQNYTAISPAEAARAKMPKQSAKDKELTGPVPGNSLDALLSLFGGME